ncbi:sulfur carrier protein ThiS [Pseudoalteromonas xiamenensis]|uniref:sulfur carrier protein ThiS n=1 Tax=Pseudoalteromonas xiamenensis TaxID=882626 RepID=UPI0027E41700|nr:sulfur carrier protein ThiS [Pseudoalteromonas xiamenensis]WMN58838.1 sulfur carrier protein ThiS [Pseudoalteromonas xiamenensis]
MKLLFNGDVIEVPEDSVLHVVIDAQGAKKPFAVAVNGQFVPSSILGGYILNNGDSIEVLSPIQGG